MTFAAPLALAFFALFIPVVLLYLLKQRRRRMEVSTLMFWEKILRDEQTVTSMSKLKKLLSLLLQLLFITLLALAIARPLLSGKLTGARRIVLLLDTSASMLVQEGRQTRFEMARQIAHDDASICLQDARLQIGDDFARHLAEIDSQEALAPGRQARERR